jgi:hypothetical protein
MVRIAMRGRHDINDLIVTAASADSDDDRARQLRALDGHEQYVMDVWWSGPLTDDDDDAAGSEDFSAIS